MKLNALVLTNMYPENGSYSGIFVKKNIEGLEKNFKVTVIRAKTQNNKLGRLLSYAFFVSKALIHLRNAKKKYSFIYIHFPTRTAIPLLFLKKLDVSLILNFHGTDIISNSKINKLLFLLMKRKFSSASLIVVPSQFFKKKIIEKLDTKNIFISPSSGVPDSFYDVTNTRPHKESILKITSISNINEDKGVFDVCEAAIKLYRKGINNQFLFFGSGSKEKLNKLQSYIDACPLIMYKGPVNHYEIPEILKDTDFFIFASKKESLGLVGIEALATGTPIIGSNHPAITTYLEDGYNGLIFEMGNVESLVSTINKINDKQLYQILKSNAQRSVESYRESMVHEELNNQIVRILN